MDIRSVTKEDIPELLGLMRLYCDFYGVHPSDDALLAMSSSLLASPEDEGMQLMARDERDRAIGFATIFWSWNTLIAARIGVMNDLYVIEDARGTGVAEALIVACKERCRSHGAAEVCWQTAKDNRRAQTVYERAGADRAEWLDYSLQV